jgi:double-strand break repair protein MRE11
MGGKRDPIRGRDSFMALEEVLLLVQTHGVDMVLLSGDLFHENKPSRKMLHAKRSRTPQQCPRRHLQRQ